MIAISLSFLVHPFIVLLPEFHKMPSNPAPYGRREWEGRWGWMRSNKNERQRTSSKSITLFSPRRVALQTYNRLIVWLKGRSSCTRNSPVFGLGWRGCCSLFLIVCIIWCLHIRVDRADPSVSLLLFSPIVSIAWSAFLIPLSFFFFCSLLFIILSFF